MKKLMIAAATAAMVGGAFAALPEDGANIDGAGVGSMYNVAITLKTLMPTVVGSVKGCPICPEDGTCHLFEQGTVKINGIFASCDCDEPFKYGYYWIGSGKKAIPVLAKLPANSVEYTSLLEDVMAFKVIRFGKTNKKATATLSIENDEWFTLGGTGFGSYTVAKYKYNKDDDAYELKTPAKVSISGSIVGSIQTAKLIEFADVDADAYVAFPVDGVCTVDVDCNDGVAQDEVPAAGTFSVKPRSIAKLSKVIPAACFE